MIALVLLSSCRTPSDPVGVITENQITIDTGGYCRDIDANDSLIVVAADENGYQTYRYHIEGNTMNWQLIDEVNYINNDNMIDRLWDVVLTDKINGNGYPLFFGMDYGDAVFYQNVNAPSSFNWQVPPDGSSNREKVRAITIDQTQDNRIFMYVLKESEDAASNYISIRNLEIQYDLDSSIIFWGALSELYNGLNIDSQDIYFADSTLYVANSQLGIQIFNQLPDGNLLLISEFDGIPGEVTEIYSSNNVVFAGLTNDKGCYLALLDSNGQPISNLRIADGYTVRGIHMYQNTLALACGNDGVLLYNISVSGTAVEASTIGVIDTEYAYNVEIIDMFCILAATRSGIQVSFIEY